MFGLVNLTQAMLPLLRLGASSTRSTRIINISSGGGRASFPNNGIYTATKYALESISDALRQEIKKFNVDVVLIEPVCIHHRCILLYIVIYNNMY